MERSSWLPVSAAVAVLAILANLRTAKSGEDTAGQTSEAAALLTYAIGALLATGHYAAAIVAGGVTAVLLHAKRPLHEFAGDLNERDLQAIMRFAIISLIILPLLPNDTYGPYEVLNPREIWLMVVLIVGIGLTGYIFYAIVIFVTSAVREHFGGGALYAVAVVSGLVDVDAITLSTARLAGSQRMDPDAAWRVILIAALSNVGFKAAAALLLGSAALFTRLAPVLLVAFTTGVALLLFWPAPTGG